MGAVHGDELPALPPRHPLRAPDVDACGRFGPATRPANKSQVPRHRRAIIFILDQPRGIGRKPRICCRGRAGLHRSHRYRGNETSLTPPFAGERNSMLKKMLSTAVLPVVFLSLLRVAETP